MILQGHEDLKLRQVFGFTSDGKALVDGGDKGVLQYDLFIGPSGTLSAKPVEQKEVDQKVEPKRDLAARMRGVDQPLQ